MTSRDFCYWLQGFFELQLTGQHAPVLESQQVQVIKNHLNLVFKHEIDPSMPDPKGDLQQAHDGNQLQPVPGLPFPPMGVFPGDVKLRC